MRQTKTNIEKIRKECLKVNRDPDDIEIAAIVYPNIECSTSNAYSEPMGNKGKWQGQQRNLRHLLDGNIEQLADDLRRIRDIGVDLAILNYNRSPISNSIDSVIGVTRQLGKLVG